MTANKQIVVANEYHRAVQGLKEVLEVEQHMVPKVSGGGDRRLQGIRWV